MGSVMIFTPHKLSLQWKC